MSFSFRLLLISLIVAWNTCIASAIEIRLKDRVEIPGDRTVVTLGDVAEVLDADPKRVETWKAVVLNPAPATGSEATLDHTLISSRLQACGFTLIDADFRGAGRVTVTTSSTARVSTPTGDSDVQRRQQVLTLLEPHLKRYVSERAPQIGTFHFQTLTTGETYTLLSNAVPSSIQLSMISIDQTGRTYDAHVVFQTGRGIAQQASLRILLEPYPYVLASLGPMQRGQVIRAEDLAWIQLTDQQVAQARNAGFVTEPAQLIGTEVLKTIRPQDPITADQIRKSPLVRNNEIVTVTVNVSTLSVSRQFRARNDAAMGESVSLTSLDGKDSLTATVSGYRTAVIDGESQNTNSIRTVDAQGFEIPLSAGQGASPGRIPVINASSSTNTSATPSNFSSQTNQAHVLPSRDLHMQRR